MIRTFAVALVLIIAAMMAKVWLGSQTVITGYEMAELRAGEKALSAKHTQLLYEVNRAASTEEVARRVNRLGLSVLPPGMDEASWELARSLHTAQEGQRDGADEQPVAVETRVEGVNGN